MKIIKFYLLLLLSFQLQAQKNHDLICNRGLVPKIFTSTEVHSVSSHHPRSRKEMYLLQSFNDKSDYFVSKFLNSGLVIYQSEANNYVNQVANKLLESDKELRKKIQIYLVRSSEVNAYTMKNGMIFMNLGLLAHLNNEAELAFVLAHEVIHYQKQHSYERFKRQVDSEVKKKEKKHKDEEDEEMSELLDLKFSRQQEFEADKEGFKLFCKTSYARSSALSVFDVLKFADFPFSLETVNRSFFEGPYLKIPSVYFPDSAASFVIKEDKDDSLQTHPNIANRKSNIQKLPEALEAKGQPFILSEKMFDDIRLACRFELSSLYNSERDYVTALFNTALLLQSYPNDQWLLTEKVKSLYYLLLISNTNSLRGIVRFPKRIKGELQKFHTLFTKATGPEMNSICLRNAWDVYSQLPKTEEMTLFVNGITLQFESAVSTDLSYFKKMSEYDANTIASFYIKDTSESKTKRFTGKTTHRKAAVKLGSFAAYAMPDYLNDPLFVKTFKELSSEVPPKEQTQVEEDTEEVAQPKKTKTSKHEEPVATKIDFNSDKVMLIDVSSIQLDLRKEQVVKYTAIYQKQQNIVETFKRCAELNGLTVDVINPINISEEDSTLLNDRFLLQNWKRERLLNEDVPAILPEAFSDLSELAKRHQCRYVAYISNGNLIDNKDLIEAGLLNILYALAAPPLFFGAVYNLATKTEESFLEIHLYDMLKGKEVVSHDEHYNFGDRQDVLNSEFYYFFFKLNHPE